MTTLNTIIEEEKKKLKNYEDTAPSGAVIVNAYYETIEHLLTTAIQRAYEAGRQSVDISKDV